MQIAVKAVALNHIDVWGFRGMAFAKRKLPLVVGAEAAGEIAAVGDGVTGFKAGDPVVMYGALTCGTCKACREGRDNLCENVAGIMGFHVDGFARDRLNMPARLVIPVPKGVAMRDAACAPIAFSTVEHMLFDNAKLQPGETILVQAGGSGIGTVAIKMAKAIGCTVITTVGDDDKAEKAKALGADHVINYRKERFETITRKLTNKKGVDVVFEHVGGEGFNGSLLVLKRGGRLVTCGATAGPTITFNLMQLFQQQYKIFGSFGASMRNIRDSLAKMADGLTPVIDTEVAAGRSRARPRAARKPPGVRQDRRAVLDSATGAALGMARVRTTACIAPASAWPMRVSASSPCGALKRDPAAQSRRHVECRRRLSCGGVGPLAAGASHRPRQSRRGLSGEIGRRDRGNPARRLGQSRPRRRRVRPYRPAVGLRPRQPRPRPHHGFRPRANGSCCGCATTASRR